MLERYEVKFKVPVTGDNAFYNAAILPNIANTDETIVLLGREVDIKTNRESRGDIDRGPLVKIRLQGGQVATREIVEFPPEFNGYNAEDPRIYRLRDGNLLVGLTAACGKGPNVTPHPAVCFLDAKDGYTKPRDIVIGEMKAKNVTPLGIQSMPYIIAMRLEGKKNRHKLDVYSVENSEFYEEGQIIPSNIPDWMAGCMGTCGPIMWGQENECGGNAFLALHGQAYGFTQRTENGYKLSYFPEYSLGGGKLEWTKKYGKLSFKLQVSDQPVFSPDMFPRSDFPQLHPTIRTAMYCVHTEVKQVNLDVNSGTPEECGLYVISIGDMQTQGVLVPKEILLNGLYN